MSKHHILLKSCIFFCKLMYEVKENTHSQVKWSSYLVSATAKYLIYNIFKFLCSICSLQHSLYRLIRSICASIDSLVKDLYSLLNSRGKSGEMLHRRWDMKWNELFFIDWHPDVIPALGLFSCCGWGEVRVGHRYQTREGLLKKKVKCRGREMKRRKTDKRG